MIETIAIIGAGNGGKATAADLALQGRRVRLFEFPEYRANLEELIRTRRLTVTGAFQGCADLQAVTCDLAAALDGTDTVIVCTQALAHQRVARELAPLIRPEHLVILSPGSTGGSLELAHVLRRAGIRKLPILAELSTLPYGCRAQGAQVDVKLRVKRVVYGVLPGLAAGTVGPKIEALIPGLVRGASVLEAGLNNGNPIIHPAITLLNAARIEKEGPRMFFYKDGVTPVVARMIQTLDEERMALLRALGYPAQSEPATSVAQGYASSTDYLKCYSEGAGFIGFTSPSTLDHRYLHEDIGVGLVMFCSIGRLLGVPTPACEAVARVAAALTGVDYLAQRRRSLETLGLGGLSVAGLKRFLETGEIRGNDE